MAAPPPITAKTLWEQSRVIRKELEGNMELFNELLISPPMSLEGGITVATFRPSKITKMPSNMSRMLDRLYTHFNDWRIDMDEKFGWHLIETAVDEAHKKVFLQFLKDMHRATERIPVLLGFIYDLYFTSDAHFEEFSKKTKDGVLVPEALDLELHAVVSYLLNRLKTMAEKSGLYAQRELAREQPSEMSIDDLEYLARRCNRISRRVYEEFDKMRQYLTDRSYEEKD
jgi:hypothetical protein